jgi:hypothetical protein
LKVRRGKGEERSKWKREETKLYMKKLASCRLSKWTKSKKALNVIRFLAGQVKIFDSSC